MRPQLIRVTRAALVPLALIALGACGQTGTETEVEETVAAVVEEIANTANEAASSLMDEGHYLADVGRGVAARAKFAAAAAADSDSVQAHIYHASNALSFAEFQQSVDAAAANKDNGNDGEKKLVEIFQTFLSNNNDRGLELGRELVASHPNSPRALLTLAGLQSGANDNEGARASYARVLELAGEHAGGLFGMANNYLFSEPRDFVKAEEWANKILAAFPNEAKGHEVMGDIKRAQNDLDGALTAYNTVSELDPTLELGHHKRGHVNSFLGNIDDARTAYSQAIEMAPAETKANYAVYRAFTRIHAGEPKKAIAELVGIADDLSVFGTPDGQAKGAQIFALNSAAQVAMHAGMPKRAAKLIERRNQTAMAIATDVGTEDANRLQTVNCHLWSGLLAASNGEGEGAAAAAAAIEGLVANDANPRKMEGAHYVLGMAALESGDHAAAVDHLRQADYRNNMYVRYNLALAEEAAGNAEEAATLFNDVASYNFNSVGFALVGRDAAAKGSAAEEAA